MLFLLQTRILKVPSKYCCSHQKIYNWICDEWKYIFWEKIKDIQICQFLDNWNGQLQLIRWSRESVKEHDLMDSKIFKWFIYLPKVSIYGLLWNLVEIWFGRPIFLSVRLNANALLLWQDESMQYICYWNEMKRGTSSEQ